MVMAVADADAQERTSAELDASAASSLSVVLRMLSSDDDAGDEDDDDDDAATTMGSPVPAAQTLDPATPPLSQQPVSQESVSFLSGGGAWVQRPPAPSRPARVDEAGARSADTWTPRHPLRGTAVTAPSRPKRIGDLFASVSSVAHSADDSEETKQEEEGDDPSQHKETEEARPPELLLSPASQLHILSQISEMAESRAVRERQASAAANNAAQTQLAARPRHAWAPIAQQAQSQQELPSRKKIAPKRKLLTSSKAPAAKKSLRSANSTITAGLLAEVAMWGAFDERILEGEDAEDDEWSFEELSDSDF